MEPDSVKMLPTVYVILNTLDGAKTLSKMANDTGRAKSTVCQWANMLADFGLIRKSVDGGVVYYEVTALGAVLREKLKDVVEFVEVLHQAGNYFSSHDISPIPIDLLEDLRYLKGCRIVQTTDPYELCGELSEMLCNSSWIYGVFSVFHPKLLEMLSSLAKKKRVMLILSDRALEKARRELSGFEEVSVSVCEGLRLNLTVAEKGLSLSLYSAKGEYDSSLLMCTSEMSIEWGRRLFECYVRMSRKVKL